jgi:hypothetical protein
MQTSNAVQQIMNVQDMPTPALHSLIWRKIQALFANDPRPHIPDRVELEDLLEELVRRIREPGDAPL